MTITFADLTTMRVGGPVGRLRVPETTPQLVEILRESRGSDDPLLVMGGGSNLVVGDIGWHGTVVKVASSEFDIQGDQVTAAAGAVWDDVVSASLDEGLAGLEALSGIPGSAGGTPVQNVGAFGTVTADVLESLTVYDRQTDCLERWSPDRCGFGSHRQSVFKRSGRWVVVDVTFRLRRASQSRSIEYVDLAKKLDIEVGGTAPPSDVRDAVLELRRSRGMVLDPEDHDTWSVGSFFVNPVLTHVPDSAAGCPRYFDVKGTKLPAAWLIEHAGFPRGYGREWGNGTVALSSRHALAVTNRGGATAADVMKFAAHVRDGVEAHFGIRLGPECDLVNCSF
ncbi:UDP-N-acetylmuramate dehydrogenase [Micromonospora sp. NPDC002389]|uniref:UDP-N-acetylmuramate dehydrogenase n=1 Tax=Micromonospora sp. NPDC002389 TaxID=3154272 RepID=UPI0033199092